MNSTFNKNSILQSFETHGIQTGRGGLKLGFPHIRELLELCHDNDLTVVGMKAVIYENGGFVEQRDGVFDAADCLQSTTTWSAFCECSHKAATEFLDRMMDRPNIVFSMELFNVSDWEFEVE